MATTRERSARWSKSGEALAIGTVTPRREHSHYISIVLSDAKRRKLVRIEFQARLYDESSCACRAQSSRLRGVSPRAEQEARSG